MNPWALMEAWSETMTKFCAFNCKEHTAPVLPCWYCGGRDAETNEEYDPKKTAWHQWPCEACDERRPRAAIDAKLVATQKALGWFVKRYNRDHGPAMMMFPAEFWQVLHDLPDSVVSEGIPNDR